LSDLCHELLEIELSVVDVKNPRRKVSDKMYFEVKAVADLLVLEVAESMASGYQLQQFGSQSNLDERLLSIGDANELDKGKKRFLEVRQ
jgi:hypothetical protein